MLGYVDELAQVTPQDFVGGDVLFLKPVFGTPEIFALFEDPVKLNVGVSNNSLILVWNFTPARGQWIRSTWNRHTGINVSATAFHESRYNPVQFQFGKILPRC